MSIENQYADTQELTTDFVLFLTGRIYPNTQKTAALARTL